MNPLGLWPPIMWGTAPLWPDVSLTSFRVAHSKLYPRPHMYLKSCSFLRDLYLNMAINTERKLLLTRCWGRRRLKWLFTERKILGEWCNVLEIERGLDCTILRKYWIYAVELYVNRSANFVQCIYWTFRAKLQVVLKCPLKIKSTGQPTDLGWNETGLGKKAMSEMIPHDILSYSTPY